MKNIKICCAIPHLSFGGMERVMSELVNNFINRDSIDVHLVLFGGQRNVNYEIDQRVIIHQPDFEFNNKHRLYYTIKNMLWLRSEIRIISPDTILSFGEYWNNLVLFSLLGKRYSIFVSDRSTPNKNLGMFHNYLRYFLYKKAKGIICQTITARDLTIKRYNYNNVTVIGNPIRRINTDSAKRENVVISVGRLINTKHYDRLIRIFSSIDTDWKLQIVGGDAQKQNNLNNLNNLIKELNAQDKIELLGYRTDIDDLLSRSRVFAFTSSSEGFPNVVGEALSAGLPVVAYDCMAGPADIIEDNKSGFLVPLFEDNLFAAKLNLLIKDNSILEDFSKAAIASIRKFESNKICQKYFDFITQ